MTTRPADCGGRTELERLREVTDWQRGRIRALEAEVAGLRRVQVEEDELLALACEHLGDADGLEFDQVFRALEAQAAARRDPLGALVGVPA